MRNEIKIIVANDSLLEKKYYFCKLSQSPQMCEQEALRVLSHWKLFLPFFPDKTVFQCVPHGKLKNISKRSLFLVSHKEYIERQVGKGKRVRTKQEKVYNVAMPLI